MSTKSTSSMAPSLFQATTTDLKRYAPFDAMEEGHLRFLVERLTLSYFSAGATLIDPNHGVPDRLLIIKQGSVAGTGGRSATIYLEEGDMLPVGSLIGKRPTVLTFNALEDTFCYALPDDDFDALIEQSATFANFCTRRMASLLEQSQRRVQSDYAVTLTNQPLGEPLLNLIRRSPVACHQELPVAEGVQMMRDAGVSALLITDVGGRLRGIFTLRDLRNLIADGQYRNERPIGELMRSHPQVLPPSATAFEAAMVMAKHGFHHVPVVQDDQLLGMVSETDLFALQRLSVTQINTAIAAAGDVPNLSKLAADIRLLARNLLAQGVNAAQLTELVSILNDQITQRLIRLELAHAGLSARNVCWLAFGSEGRMEQTLASDQNNGLVFIEDNHPEQRNRLLGIACHVNEALARCGFRLCAGNVMASNPDWCLSLEEWKQTFSHWIDHPDPQTLRSAKIFFDFRPLWGNEKLAFTLRHWVTSKAKGRQEFLQPLGEIALSHHRPPLGMIRDFSLDEHEGRQHTLDLKRNGASIFVDAARIFALATGIQATGTVQRLQDSANALDISDSEVNAWSDAFYFIQMLRLKRQQEAAARGEKPDNYLDPDTLNDIDRRILKEAFRQALNLQNRLKVVAQI